MEMKTEGAGAEGKTGHHPPGHAPAPSTFSSSPLKSAWSRPLHYSGDLSGSKLESF